MTHDQEYWQNMAANGCPYAIMLVWIRQIRCALPAMSPVEVIEAGVRIVEARKRAQEAGFIGVLLEEIAEFIAAAERHPGPH